MFQSFISIFFVLLKQSIAFLLPPRCFVTGDPVEAPGLLAASVWQKLRFVTKPYCQACGIPFEVDMADETLCVDCLQNAPSYIRARAPLVYDEGCKPIILGFKHNDRLEAVTSITPLMVSVFPALQDTVDYIVPVPLHWRRLLQRRYNQSAILAYALGRAKSIPVLVDGLVRHENTQTQGGKKRDERILNVKNAFSINPKHAAKIKGKKILVIDDVMTTGATVDSCAKTLVKAGASGVYVLCIARVLKKDFQAQDPAASPDA